MPVTCSVTHQCCRLGADGRYPELITPSRPPVPFPCPAPGLYRTARALCHPGHLGHAIQVGATPGEATFRAGSCTGADPGRERETLRSSQQPNFRVWLLFLELSSSLAWLVGRPRVLLGLCTHSSTSGTSPSSHNTWTIGTRSVCRRTHMGISSTCPITPIAL